MREAFSWRILSNSIRKLEPNFYQELGFAPFINKQKK